MRRHREGTGAKGQNDDPPNEEKRVISFPFWNRTFGVDGPDDGIRTFNFMPEGNRPIRYPITMELPNIELPISKRAQATEGMLDTGGACTPVALSLPLAMHP